MNGEAKTTNPSENNTIQSPYMHVFYQIRVTPNKKPSQNKRSTSEMLGRMLKQGTLAKQSNKKSQRWRAIQQFRSEDKDKQNGSLEANTILELSIKNSKSQNVKPMDNHL